MEADGNKYKHCICWRAVAGHSYACYDFCDKEQREACQKQQSEDFNKDITELEKQYPEE